MKTYTHQAGYSLIEVLIAIAVLLLSIAGPLTIASKSLQTSYNSRDQVVATFLAQEGIEGITAIRQDYMIAAAQDAAAGGNFSASWDWTSGSGLNSCRATVGCNIDLADLNPMTDIENCGNPNNCQMQSDGTVFRRVMRLTNLDPETVQVTATVSWENSGFSGSEENREVSVSTLLFDIYGDL